MICDQKSGRVKDDSCQEVFNVNALSESVVMDRGSLGVFTAFPLRAPSPSPIAICKVVNVTKGGVYRTRYVYVALQTERGSKI